MVVGCVGTGYVLRVERPVQRRLCPIFVRDVGSPDIHEYFRGLTGSQRTPGNGVSQTTENITCWTTGPALTGRLMSPIVTVVSPLKSDRIFPAELSLSKEMFIYMNACSCNRSAMLLRSTSTLCTSKSLIHKVSTSASWCGIMTLEGLMWGKDMGSSINWTALLLSRAWIVFILNRTVAAQNNLFCWRLD